MMIQTRYFQRSSQSFDQYWSRSLSVIKGEKTLLLSVNTQKKKGLWRKVILRQKTVSASRTKKRPGSELSISPFPSGVRENSLVVGWCHENIAQEKGGGQGGREIKRYKFWGTDSYPDLTPCSTYTKYWLSGQPACIHAYYREQMQCRDASH